MSVFVLKIIACISMFIDHTKFIFGNVDIVNKYFGRFAFPIYAFLISEGYVHTKNFAKYLGRLLIFAAISQIPAYLLFKPFLNVEPYLNIFFTLALGLIAIRFYDKVKNRPLAIILVILTAMIADLLHTDYGMLGVLLIAVFYIFRNHKMIMMLVASLILVVNCLLGIPEFSPENFDYIRQQLILALFSVCSLLFICAYNGKLGKSNKYIKILFYLFYPVHLLVFYITRLIFI